MDPESQEAQIQSLKNAIEGQDEMIKARDEKIGELNKIIGTSMPVEGVLLCALIALIVGLIGGWYFL